MHIWRSIAIPSPWLVIILTMYSTVLTYAVIFNIGEGVESANLGLLAKFYAQLVGLVV